MRAKHFLDGLDPDLRKSLLQELKVLWAFGQPKPVGDLIVPNREYKHFEKFCVEAWEPSQKLLKEIRAVQGKRSLKVF